MWLDKRIVNMKKTLVVIIVVFGVGISGSLVSKRMAHARAVEEELAYLREVCSHSIRRLEGSHSTDDRSRNIAIFRKTLAFLADRESIERPFLMSATLYLDDQLFLIIDWLEDGFTTEGIELQVAVGDNHTTVRLPVFRVPDFWSKEERAFYTTVERHLVPHVIIGRRFGLQAGRKDELPVVTVPKAILDGKTYATLYDQQGEKSNIVEIFITTAARDHILQTLAQATPASASEKP